jgi:hypothetical protein
MQAIGGVLAPLFILKATIKYSGAISFYDSDNCLTWSASDICLQMKIDCSGRNIRPPFFDLSL